MKNQYTPGPWRIGPENCGSGRNVYSGKDYIAHTVGYNAKPGSNQRTLSEQEAKANAALIAAAPELLQALQELVAHVESCRQSWQSDGSEMNTKAHGLAVCLNNRAGDMIAAAIAKATA